MISLSDCQRWAVLSECGTYRMLLGRSERTNTHKACAWVLNNPSTADGEVDDPTVKRAWAFSQSWGYNYMLFLNTNPFRSTDPKGAKVPPEEVLAANDAWLARVQSICSLVVCGWGDKANPILAKRAALMLHTCGPIHALRETKQGNPQHPLYLPGNLKPTSWVPYKWLQ